MPRNDEPPQQQSEPTPLIEETAAPISDRTLDADRLHRVTKVGEFISALTLLVEVLDRHGWLDGICQKLDEMPELEQLMAPFVRLTRAHWALSLPAAADPVHEARVHEDLDRHGETVTETVIRLILREQTPS